MKITQLRLDHFRNYSYLDLELDEGTNLFYGDNAQGKTNILESVYLCGTSRSHRNAKDREMIAFGSDESHIRMHLVKNDITYRVDMHLKKNRAKGIAVNGSVIHRASELIGLCGFVFFSPEDLNMIKAGPSERRRFMNMELSQMQKVYVHALAGYQKALAQRNQLLKDMAFYPDSGSMLEIWNEQLVSYGCRIIEERKAFAAQLNEIIGPIHEKLSGGTEQLHVEYQPNVPAEHFMDELLAAEGRDRKMKTTTVGPHKDDLVFMTNGVDLRKYGSQGQQRTCALSLKLSEIELMQQVKQDTPILLLDDVISELDSKRQHFLLQSIDHVQTLITGTGVDDFAANRFKINKMFHVVSGTAQEI